MLLYDGYHKPMIHKKQGESPMTIQDAISNLDKMSQALDKVANKPENYNSDWAYYLEQMSWSLHKHANELRDLEYLFDVSLNEKVV